MQAVRLTDGGYGSGSLSSIKEGHQVWLSLIRNNLILTCASQLRIRLTPAPPIFFVGAAVLIDVCSTTPLLLSRAWKRRFSGHVKLLPHTTPPWESRIREFFFAFRSSFGCSFCPQSVLSVSFRYLLQSLPSDWAGMKKLTRCFWIKFV